MRRILRDDWLALTFLLASCVLVSYYWPMLPAQVPTHWGLDGLPDAYAAKVPGALIGPMVGVFVYLLMTALPALDPRFAQRGEHPAYPHVLKTGLQAFFLFLTFATLTAATHPAQQLATWTLTVGVGLTYMVLGNYLPKLRSNFFIGVRTPWTLSSDEVWSRTHRVVGRWMVVVGLAMLAAVVLPPAGQFAAILAGSLGLAALSLAYSYWLFLQEKRAS